MSHSTISLGLGLGGGKSATSSGAAGGGGASSPLLIYTITNTGGAFYLRSAVGNEYTVDWGDGSSETSTLTALSHTYAASGTYTINVSSDLSYRPSFARNGATSEDQITSIEIRGGFNLGTNLYRAWDGAQNMTSFVASSETSTVENFGVTWYLCSGFTSFPALDLSSGTDFSYAWGNCSSLATFPANMFDTTGTLGTGAFNTAWSGCALTAQSIENILVSLVVNSASNVTLTLNGGTNAGYSTWSPAAVTAFDTLENRGWTIAKNA